MNLSPEAELACVCFPHVLPNPLDYVCFGGDWMTSKDELRIMGNRGDSYLL